MQVQARLNNFRRSAQKVRESSSIIKGLNAMQALSQLEYSKKGDGEVLRKLLKSAIANAENNYNLEKDNLFVSNVIVEEGKTMKRWRPRAYGRAAQILKRTCNVVIFLDEIEEGKSKKAPKKTKSVDIKKQEKEEEVKEEKKKTVAPKKEELNNFSKKKDVGAAKKVYRRKSF